MFWSILWWQLENICQVILTSLHLTGPLFILFEICLALDIITLKKKQQKKNHGHSGYYVIKLWVLFQLDILANFLWNCFCRGRVSSYCQKWVEIQISFLASTDTLGGCCLLLFNVGRNSGFLEGSHNTCMAGRDTSAWRLLSTGFPVTQWGRRIYFTADWWLLLFIKSFIYQYGHMDV